MVILPKLLGTIDAKYIDLLDPNINWAHKEFYELPFPLVSYPKGYWLTLGSACPVSCATTSLSGIIYNVSWDVIRQDFKDECLINIDQYVGSFLGDATYKLIKMPPTPYHHPAENNEIYEKLTPLYRKAVIKLYSDTKRK